MFKKTFKFYKRKNPSPDLHDVIDFDLYESSNSQQSWYNLVKPVNVSNINTDLSVPVGLHPQHMWRCYKLDNHPGLVVIRNAFTVSGQRYWIARCLRDYPKEPNVVNLNRTLFSDAAICDWWRELHQCTDLRERDRLKDAMRWTTLGYHHNWDTKVYNENMRTKFPHDLSNMCQFFSCALGFSHYIPQAAIVNYYPMGTNLSGHTDHSELNLNAPLFSFSFGQTAIFLIGGKTLDREPTAVFLRSGDVLVMSQETRLCYHAVPRIIKETSKMSAYEYNECKEHYDVSTENNFMDLELYDQVDDEVFWAPFCHYVKDARININIRQVLPAGVSQIK